MADTAMLRKRISEKGIKLGHIAEVMGMTNGTLRSKLENETEFKVSEAERLSAMLGMTRDERDHCFFGPAG